MPVQFDDLAILKADGRSVMHLQSDDVQTDVAELEYLLTHWARINQLPKEYDIVPARRSVWLLEKPR